MSPTLSSLGKRFWDLTADFNGPVPTDVLQNLLFGSFSLETGMPVKAGETGDFDYPVEKISKILDIAEHNIERVKNLPSVEQPTLIACGGGPGSGKSTALFRQLVEEYHIHDLSPRDWYVPCLYDVVNRLFLSKKAIPVALVAPDRKALLQLALAEHGSATTNRAFYINNRAATNFLSLSEFDAGLAYRKDVVWDTTLGSPAKPGSLGPVDNIKYAKKESYKFSFLPVGAPLDIRQQAADVRNLSYFQSLPFNLTAQEDGFRKNMPDVIALADRVLLSWRDRINHSAQTVATIDPIQKLMIVENNNGYGSFCRQYPQIDALGYEATGRRPGNFDVPRRLRFEPR